jgi:hypothetical protein
MGIAALSPSYGLPEQWEVHCRCAGRRDQAPGYLYRYVYRCVISTARQAIGVGDRAHHLMLQVRQPLSKRG